MVRVSDDAVIALTFFVTVVGLTLAVIWTINGSRRCTPAGSSIWHDWERLPTRRVVQPETRPEMDYRLCRCRRCGCRGWEHYVGDQYRPIAKPISEVRQ